MKAVVLAAGRGKRLGALTAQTPKPLLCVGGEPMLARIVRGLAAAAVDEVAIVTGYLGGQVRAHFGDGGRFGLAISWFDQPEPNGTAGAVALARAFAGEEPFLFAWGDIVIDTANYARVAALYPSPTLAVNVVDDPWDGGAVYLDGDGLVERLVEKPPRSTSTTYLNNAGLGILPPAIWEDIARLEPSPRGELELPAAIGANIARGGRFRAVTIEGPWFDAGTAESLAAARAAFGGCD